MLLQPHLLVVQGYHVNDIAMRCAEGHDGEEVLRVGEYLRVVLLIFWHLMAEQTGQVLVEGYMLYKRNDPSPGLLKHGFIVELRPVISDNLR